jgi:hypothetical protein
MFGEVYAVDGVRATTGLPALRRGARPAGREGRDEEIQNLQKDLYTIQERDTM